MELEVLKFSSERSRTIRAWADEVDASIESFS